MTMSDVAAQVLSIFVSAIGLIVFRLIARYLPEDPPPVPRAPAPPVPGRAPPESEEHHG